MTPEQADAEATRLTNRAKDALLTSTRPGKVEGPRLLKAIAARIRTPEAFEDVLNSVADLAVRDRLRAALRPLVMFTA